MAEERVKRRLAAILAADVVSYSRLMRADEAGTLARLKNHRKELIDPAFEAHEGRIVKTTGDGFLVEFASVVGAVECAADIQREMAARNASVPEDQRFDFRVGINLGDVIIDGDDIHGDGVNIAARLEGLAKPGEICVSHPVYESVKDKIEHGFDYLGKRVVKNIETPVQVYRVRLDGKPVPTRQRPESRRMWIALAALFVAGIALFAVFRPTPESGVLAAPIVAVLPFRAIGGDGDEAVLGEGLTEDLIATLSDQTGLRIISGRLAIASAEQPRPDPRDVGRELSARYVLDGSVRATGEQVRITALLVDTVTGYHLWGVHVILDNYAAHKHAKVRAWLGRHERFTFHFVPTSCSWLNAVEGFFAKLSKRRLKRGVFRSIVDLQVAINRFLDETNDNPKPFTWTADPGAGATIAR